MVYDDIQKMIERINRLIATQERMSLNIEQLLKLVRMSRMIQKMEYRADELDAKITDIERRRERLSKDR